MSESGRILKWDLRFMAMAQLIAENSKDSTKVGCVIVDGDLAILATGYNGAPRHVVDSPDRYARPKKYLFMVHAEGNAIADTARRGVNLKDSTMFVSRFPCSNCAGLLIQAGVKAVVGRKPDPLHPRWGASWRAALEMLAEAEVEVRYLEVEPAKSRSLGEFLENPFPEK
jgi:dCMP deaminase